MAFWSAVGNAIGGALKNLGNVFGGPSTQSIGDRFGHAISAAYDIGGKAPADVLGMGAHLAGAAWNGFNTVDQRVYTDLISHPASDILQMQNKALYAFNNGGFGSLWNTMTSGQSWIDGWNESSHFSPGQEIVLAANNIDHLHNPVLRAIGQALPPITTANGLEATGVIGGNTQWERNQEINPSDVNAVNTLIGNNSWGNRLASGVFDATLRTYLDPAGRVLKPVGGLLKAVKNNPVKSGSDLDSLMSKPRTQRLINWVPGKDAATIAEHPAFKNSAFRYSIANALSGASSPEEASLLLRTLAGDKNAWNDLAKTNQGLAFRQAHMLAPPEVMEKFALAPGKFDALNNWLQPVEKSKAAAATAQLAQKTAAYQNILDAAGSMIDRTTSSKLAETMASARASAKYARIARPEPISKASLLQPSRLVSTIQGHAYNVPIRIYHALTDKPPMGFINHNDDNAVDQVRSWLNKSKVLTPDAKKDYAAQYAQMSKGQRAAGWNRIENDVYNRIGEAYKLQPAQMAQILNETRSRGMAYAQGAKSGAYGVLSTPDGQQLHLLATGDGELVAHPDLITQLQAGANPMTNIADIERAIGRMDSSGVLAAARDRGAAGTQFLMDQLDRVYGVWKPLSLMTMHRAYNHVGDDLLRGMAKVGGLTMASNAVEGVGNFMRNRLARFTMNSFVRNEEGKWEQQVNTARSQFHGLLSQAKDQKWRIANGEQIPDANRVQISDVRKAADRYQALKNNKPVFIQPKHRLGTGTSVVPGTNIRMEDAFGGPNADYLRQLTSSEQFFQSQINDSAHNLYQIGRSNMSGPGFDVINASENPGPWLKAYLHYVNNQLRPDPVANMLLKGKSPDAVESWLSNSTAGKQYMRDLHKGDTWAQVQAVQDHIDKYLPTQSMKDAALSRGVKKADVEQTWKAASQRPEVNGNLNLMIHGGHPSTQMLKNTTQKLLKLTGTMPDDILVRHPVFNELYKARRNTMVKVAADQTADGKLTTAELDRLSRTAMTQARKDLQNLVYDTSRFNDAGHLLRFVSPFFNAWFNAMTSWSKLFAENPELLGRAAVAHDAIWNSPLAVDTSTGERAGNDTPLSNLAIVAHIPKPVARLLGSSDLSYLPIKADTLISPTYADSIGNPGFGPLVQIPVNQLAKMSPSVAEDPAVAAILGNRITKNSLQSAIPSGASQFMDLLGMAGVTGDQARADDALNRATLTWQIYQNQMYEYQHGERSNPPNIQDIQGQAGTVAAVDTVLNRLMPLGFKPQGAGQFYVDQYHAMLDQDPQNAQANFVKKYGEQAYVFTQSLDQNVAGIPATAGAIKAYKQHESLIAQNPEIAPVVIGIQGDGNFDEMAYQWEQANGLRTYQTPEQAAKAANVGQGWYDYETMMSKINVVLQDRGLTSIKQAGAKDLRDFRTQYEQSTNDPTSPYYNPDWYAAFTGFNQGAYDQRIQALEKVSTDPALINNPMRSDIRSLNAYFQARDQALYYLSDRQNKSLTAKANADVANWFDYQVSQLIQNDTKFQQIYDRYLKNDDLKFQ